MAGEAVSGVGDRLLDLDGLEALVRALRDRSYRVIGPTVRDGAIRYDEISSIADLPRGWTDEQDGGTYRLRRRDDEALFGYAVGPHSWKQFLFPPQTLLMRVRRTGDGGLEMRDASQEEEAPRLAFLAARACDLNAIAIQDRVFLQRGVRDPTYATRRENAFIVAVNCGEPAGTCFCVSMGTGPRAEGGFDLALTEVLDGDGHRFVVEVGTEQGAEVLAGLPSQEAWTADREAADAVVASAASRMGRHMDTDGIKELLYRNYEHPRWDEVASRCLSCTNCTMVCPTCFCSTVEDTTDLTGQYAERSRVWDSCFTLDHSEMGGGHVRSSNRSRYRQWMTHKLATWIDQFDTSGCVGCGRCITWCPVGIDITEELQAIRQSDGG
jgi:sulfhydrogenase subunit beta (sulfur reductase)